MDEKNRVEVIINGRVFILHGNEPEEYFQKLGQYLDEKIMEAKRVKPIRAANIDLSTLYLLINIADDMFKQQETAQALMMELREKDKELNVYMDELAKLTEENIILLDRLSECQINYTNAKNELNEFIDTFSKDQPKKGNRK